MTQFSDRDAFWAAVEAAPLDAAPKLVFADWLEERGADPRRPEMPGWDWNLALAYGLRWCAHRGRHPRTLATGRCGWRMVNFTSVPNKPYYLPDHGVFNGWTDRRRTGSISYGPAYWPGPLGVVLSTAVERAFLVLGRRITNRMRELRLEPERKGDWFPADSG